MDLLITTTFRVRRRLDFLIPRTRPELFCLYSLLFNFLTRGAGMTVQLYCTRDISSSRSAVLCVTPSRNNKHCLILYAAYSIFYFRSLRA